VIGDRSIFVSRCSSIVSSVVSVLPASSVVVVVVVVVVVSVLVVSVGLSDVSGISL